MSVRLPGMCSENILSVSDSYFPVTVSFEKHTHLERGFPGDTSGKEPACNAGEHDLGLTPGVRKISWRREWLPTLVFLPGESHGQRSLEGHKVSRSNVT